MEQDDNKKKSNRDFVFKVPQGQTSKGYKRGYANLVIRDGKIRQIKITPLP